MPPAEGVRSLNKRRKQGRRESERLQPQALAGQVIYSHGKSQIDPLVHLPLSQTMPALSSFGSSGIQGSIYNPPSDPRWAGYHVCVFPERRSRQNIQLLAQSESLIVGHLLDTVVNSYKDVSMPALLSFSFFSCAQVGWDTH